MSALGDLGRASGRAVHSLMQPGVFWHLVWPVILAAACWVLLGYFGIGPLADMCLGILQKVPHVGEWFGETRKWSHLAAGGVLELLFWLALIPLIAATALVFISTLGLPLMIERVAGHEYLDLQPLHGGSQWGSLRTALGAFTIFVIVLMLTLPLWLIPGAGGVIVVLLSAWMNKRCLCYDALMTHADPLELVLLPHEHAGRLWLLALAGGVLALVPGLNLLVPAWISLCFVHYLLEALRVRRAAMV